MAGPRSRSVPMNMVGSTTPLRSSRQQAWATCAGVERIGAQRHVRAVIFQRGHGHDDQRALVPPGDQLSRPQPFVAGLEFHRRLL